jgi:hypothetical protein
MRFFISKEELERTTCTEFRDPKQKGEEEEKQ